MRSLHRNSDEVALVYASGLRYPPWVLDSCVFAVGRAYEKFLGLVWLEQVFLSVLTKKMFRRG